MIPSSFIEPWHKTSPWQALSQVEQDLIISRALIDLYNNPHIKESLVFRGGTALNKLFISPPSRYSEDIDFVQRTPEPIGKTIDAIRSILNPWLGTPKWKITERGAKLIYRFENINNLPQKLKVEINTTEHFQVLPLQTQIFKVSSDWFKGNTEIITYELDELMATKLRALYQRRKGRDLFDMWHVAVNNLINLDRVIDIFNKYCEYSNVKISKDAFISNLEEKKNHRDFKSDMDVLLPSKTDWNFEKAYHFVIHKIIEKLP